jgi:hypothetical protein
MPSYSGDTIKDMVNFKKLTALSKQLVKEDRIKDADIIDITANDIFSRLIKNGVKYTDIFILDPETGKFYYPCAVCRGDFARPNLNAKSYTEEVVSKICKYKKLKSLIKSQVRSFGSLGDKELLNEIAGEKHKELIELGVSEGDIIHMDMDSGVILSPCAKCIEQDP